MTVLLTGATGFLGRHCLAALGIAATRSTPPPLRAVRPGRRPLAPCRSDPARRERPAGGRGPAAPALHLAWYAVSGEYWRSPENLRWVEPSLALLREFAATGAGGS